MYVHNLTASSEYFKSSFQCYLILKYIYWIFPSHTFVKAWHDYSAVHVRVMVNSTKRNSLYRKPILISYTYTLLWKPFTGGLSFQVCGEGGGGGGGGSLGPNWICLTYIPFLLFYLQVYYKFVSILYVSVRTPLSPLSLPLG